MQKIKLSHLILHLSFWVAAFSLTYMLMSDNLTHERTLLLSAILILIIMAAANVFSLYLIPQYLLKQKRFSFTLYLFFTLIASVYLCMMVVTFIFTFWAQYEYAGMPAAVNDFFRFIIIIHLIVFAFVGFYATIEWYSWQNKFLIAQKEKETNELKFLKNQLQPHFLFNTLNNLYALTLAKSEHAPEMVLRLSHLMDYVMHTHQTDVVRLEEEWDKMMDFCFLESFRYADRLKTEFQFDEACADIKIPPLLMITLVENCFKHGIAPSTKDSLLEVKVLKSKSWIVLSFKNSLEADIQKNDKNTKSNGIGIPNLQSQLDYIYPKNYEFKQEMKNGFFLTELKLGLNEIN